MALHPIWNWRKRVICMGDVTEPLHPNKPLGNSEEKITWFTSYSAILVSYHSMSILARPSWSWTPTRVAIGERMTSPCSAIPLISIYDTKNIGGSKSPRMSKRPSCTYIIYSTRVSGLSANPRVYSQNELNYILEYIKLPGAIGLPIYWLIDRCSIWVSKSNSAARVAYSTLLPKQAGLNHMGV